MWLATLEQPELEYLPEQPETGFRVSGITQQVLLTTKVGLQIQLEPMIQIGKFNAIQAEAIARFDQTVF